MKKIFYTLFLLSSVLFYANLYSQEFNTEGTEFWLTFMPNIHINENGFFGPEGASDSLYIFITSKTPTNGTIYYTEHLRDGSTNAKEFTFAITAPNQIAQFSVQYFRIALQGSSFWSYYTQPGRSAADNETICKKSIRVVTERNSTVYAMDYAEMTAEAFVVLPIQALGNEYYVYSYNSDGRYYAYDNTYTNSTPSQFAIVATNDNTNVTITPTVPTHRHNSSAEQKITLNRGDVYLVQAAITINNLQGDLTGTHIVADKPVAVFGGHNRATTPISFTNASRDCLIEQMIPVNIWGKNTIITPFMIPKKQNIPYFYRVLACQDNTYIVINNKILDTINAGEFYEDTLVAAFISSNKPILVSQYMRSEESSSGYNIGDPSLIIVPPIEQYNKEYNVINVQSNKAILEQYLTIIAPNTAINKVYVDNLLLPASQFLPIPNIPFSYIQHKTTDGGHNIRCEEPISVQIYGYGKAVSYGYLGGMSVKDVLKSKLEITTDDCKSSTRLVYKENYNTTIKDYEVEELYNLTLKEELFADRELIIILTKIDEKKDAFYKLKITDFWEEEYVYTDTLQTNIFSLSKPVDKHIDFGECKIGKLAQADITIVNHGEQSFITLDRQNLYMTNNTIFTIAKSTLPVVIPPNDSAILTIYYSPIQAKKTNDFDTLYIFNECYSAVISLEGECVADTFSFTDKCGTIIRCVGEELLAGGYLPEVVPNPASDENATYKFSITEENNVSIDLYDINGNFIMPVASDYLTNGNYELMINTQNIPTGTYFIKQNNGTETITNKLIINKK